MDLFKPFSRPDFSAVENQYRKGGMLVVALGRVHKARIKQIVSVTGETMAALVRRLIDQEWTDIVSTPRAKSEPEVE